MRSKGGKWLILVILGIAAFLILDRVTGSPAPSQKEEARYSASSKVGDFVYEDVVSLTPVLTVHTQNSINDRIICECVTTSGGTVWVDFGEQEYIQHFDSRGGTLQTRAFTGEDVTVRLAAPKRIHASVRYTSDRIDRYSPNAGVVESEYLLRFRSVD